MVDVVVHLEVLRGVTVLEERLPGALLDLFHRSRTAGD